MSLLLSTSCSCSRCRVVLGFRVRLVAGVTFRFIAMAPISIVGLISPDRGRHAITAKNSHDAELMEADTQVFPIHSSRARVKEREYPCWRRFHRWANLIPQIFARVSWPTEGGVFRNRAANRFAMTIGTTSGCCTGSVAPGQLGGHKPNSIRGVCGVVVRASRERHLQLRCLGGLPIREMDFVGSHCQRRDLYSTLTPIDRLIVE